MNDRWQISAGISTSHSCHCCMSQHEAVICLQRNACPVMVPHHNKKHTLAWSHVTFARISTHKWNITPEHRNELLSLIPFLRCDASHARPRWNVFSAAAASVDVSFESRSPLEGSSAGAPQPLSSKLTPPMNYKTNRNNPCIESRLYAVLSVETEQTVAVSAYSQSSCWGLRPI